MDCISGLKYAIVNERIGSDFGYLFSLVSFFVCVRFCTFIILFVRFCAFMIMYDDFFLLSTFFYFFLHTTSQHNIHSNKQNKTTDTYSIF